MDYLVSDAVTRSGGRIDFPSRYAQGYVYLQSKVYGDRPGTFYGASNIWLYMPHGSVKTDCIQLNTIAGRGNGNFYVALMNQSTGAVNATVTIDVPGVHTNTVYSAQVWRENKPVEPVTVRNGQVLLRVTGSGMTAIAINGLNPIPAFQAKVLDPSVAPTTNLSSVVFTNPPIGQVNGMIFTFGRELSSAYVWLPANASLLKQAKLIYRSSGGAWMEMTDRTYPFEFHVPIGDADSTFEFRVEVTLQSDGSVISTEAKILHR